MKSVLQQRFFRLLSEYSQYEISELELTEAIEELAIYLADSSMNEQDYNVLNRIVHGLSKKKCPTCI